MAKEQLLTPSPSPPPPTPTSTLPAQINVATRKQHTLLNRLIIDRLPLALPPYASDPALLGQGLAAFSRIFLVFEEAWDALDSENVVARCGETVSERRLATLRPKALRRSSRLKVDVEHIAQRAGVKSFATTSAQLAMLERMALEIQLKPHVLIAYGWVMYMAIFSGGRWIRQQFTNAGTEFWTPQPGGMQGEQEKVHSSGLPGFTFLFFEGEQDGEDIKAEFKARLAEADSLLTQDQRQDVIDAAQRLFEDCIALVEILDREVLWQKIWSKLPATIGCIAMALVTFLLYYFSRSGSWTPY
ncbi:hypothetical protein LTR37_017235 [Vermiconidia calcicola]|uniref:Uncharacterized protein n=1 Tax=Vermiconidia calcicola TaxID=1690605 RepID=A0ACC3MM41_9PEZI|nr:hypothetical protein LTR37_017235 [Vermiconidia calcicola]